MRPCPALLAAAIAIAPRAAAGSSDVTPAHARPRGPLGDITIAQRLDAQLPLQLPFRDESGRDRALGDFFGARPVILSFAYFRCPMLCGYVQGGVMKALRALRLSAGRDFDVVVVSIDPADTADAAAAKKREHVRRYGRERAESGWHFLTGGEDAIRRLAAAAGFRYVFDPGSGQFAHAAGIVVATPGGRISRYLFGVEYSPRDVRLALVEASEGRVGSPVDHVLLYCYRYDPATGKYGLLVRNALRIGGIATLVALGLLILVLHRRTVHHRGTEAQRERMGKARSGSGQFTLPALCLCASVVNLSCGSPGMPLFPVEASTLAGEVDGLFWFLVGLSAVLSTLIFVLVIVFAVKFRHRHPASRAAAFRMPLGVELVWTFVPLAIVLVIFAWGAIVFNRQATPPADAVGLYAVGKQWMWTLQHPDGRREINELHVPIGQPVRLTMTSEDVIHSFYVPAFRVKRDVLPGRYTTVWFNPTRAGQYHLFCAEYCGTRHSGMIGTVFAMDPVAYQSWLAGGEAREPLAVTGQRLFQALNCHTCHQPGGRAPLLDRLFGRTVRLVDGRTVLADEDYLRESILNPAAKLVAGFPPEMPPYQGQLSELQVLQLIAYIRSPRPPPDLPQRTGGGRDERGAKP